MAKSMLFLQLYLAFVEKHALTKYQIYEIINNKSERTLQRYLKDLNYFLDEQYGNVSINYHSNIQKYVLEGSNKVTFTKQQTLVLLKILIASRALSSEEVASVMSNMAHLLEHDDRVFIEHVLASEVQSYHPLQLDEPKIDRIWQLHEAIVSKKNIKFQYWNAMNEQRTHTIQPYFITFSETYFYIIGINQKEQTLIFRIDRIESFEVLDQSFHHTPKQHLSPMKIKDRIYFMYGGELQRIQFEFNGGIIESVLDRFPTARTIKKDHANNRYTVEVEVIGDGILMWFLSQGRRVKVLSPPSMVKKINEEIKAMINLYH
ncbi:helix-turn-helix transcriptional regulator [Macrococcus equi]|uniref:helix-turn-helix transcriptional regulator n=1 Tax=Macrococcus equi TaxID=3395462 RepID=UPI0039BE4F04